MAEDWIEYSYGIEGSSELLLYIGKRVLCLYTMQKRATNAIMKGSSIGQNFFMLQRSR